MKFIILATVIAARLVAAQDLSSLPACGQRCITNMLAKAKELGCVDDKDVACLCKNENFGNGIRDCTNESCPSDANKKSVIDTGAQFCAAALSQNSDVTTVTVVTSRHSGSAAATRAVSTVTSTLGPVSTATVVVANVTDASGRNVASTIGNLVAGGIAITTTDSRGFTFVTTATAIPPIAGGNSTGGAGNSTAAGGASNGTAVAGVPVTTTNSLGATIVTTTTPTAGSAGTTGSPTADESGSTTGSAAPSSSSPGAAVRLGAAGFAGIAGLAAVVLL